MFFKVIIKSLLKKGVDGVEILVYFFFYYEVKYIFKFFIKGYLDFYK